MTDEHDDEPIADGELDLILDEDGPEDDDEPLIAIGNAIVEVCFGDPEDESEEIERTLSWMKGFEPGLFTRQVAELFLAHGDVCIITNKLTVTVPIKTVRLLLEQANLIKEEG